MDIIASHGFTLLALACVFGLFMAWGIGANDVANAMGTSVGSRALTLKQAILVAAIFEFAGAYLAGGEVTSTIRKGISTPRCLQTRQIFWCLECYRRCWRRQRGSLLPVSEAGRCLLPTLLLALS